MLSDIYDKLELNNIDTNIIRSSIYSENTWALDWEMPGVVGSDQESTPPLVKEVVNYLEMWSFLEEAYSHFDIETKEIIAKEASPFGKYVRFLGFDGNNEPEALSISKILIEDMGRFGRFKGRDLNSHTPTLDIYKRMLAAFNPIKSSLSGMRNLDAAQVITVLKAINYQSAQ